MSGRSMNPYRATARQKRGAISWTFRRAASSIHGTASVRTVRTNRRSCRARLCFKCHTITGGASRSVRVEKHGSTWHARNSALGDPRHEACDRYNGFLEPGRDRLRAYVPDQHHTVDRGGEQQRDVSAVSDLCEVDRR